MPDSADEFASMITALKGAGLTMPQIAADSGLSRATVWRLANGAVANPGFDTFRRLESLCLRKIDDARRK